MSKDILKDFTADSVRAMMPYKKVEIEEERLANYIKRKIKGAAVANQNNIEIYVKPFSGRSLITVIEELKDNGFKTEYGFEHSWLIIKW